MPETATHPIPHCSVPLCCEAAAGFAADGYCTACGEPRCSQHSSYSNEAGERFCAFDGYRGVGPDPCELYAVACGRCEGTGYDDIDDKPCSHCGGDGNHAAQAAALATMVARKPALQR